MTGISIGADAMTGADDSTSLCPLLEGMGRVTASFGDGATEACLSDDIVSLFVCLDELRERSLLEAAFVPEVPEEDCFGGFEPIFAGFPPSLDFLEGKGELNVISGCIVFQVSAGTHA